MEVEKKIGRRKYEALKKFDLDDFSEENLELFEMNFKGLSLAEAIKQVKDYETSNFDHGDMIENVSNYFDKLFDEKPEPTDKKIITKDWLWKEFANAFRLQNGSGFIQNETTLENIKPLFYYFLGDFKNFVKCENVSNLSRPNIKKGLLIIGSYGNGKTSAMKALQVPVSKTPVRFRSIYAKEVVSEYEFCKEAQEKSALIQNYTSGIIYFDDIVGERTASNFGKLEVIQEILEKRYDKGKRTHASINYDDNHPEDTKKALEQIAERYGSRMYDRVFEMFNVIEFKGSSFR